MRRLNSALFVDFDNLFLSLLSRDPEAARAFGMAPRTWLDWLEDEVVTPGFPEDERKLRTFLIRRAYASPRAIHPFRAYFMRSAFQVVECPPLTRETKNAADIHMVMDILDVTQAFPHIEEVVIFSSDSDFTPVVTRLRAHAKRTVVYVNELTAAAYRAAADETVAEEDLAAELSAHAAAHPAPNPDTRAARRPPGASRPPVPAARPFPAQADQPSLEPPAPRPPPPPNDAFAAEIAIAIRGLVVGRTAPLPLRELVETLKERFGPRLEASRYAGAGSITAFLRRTAIDGVAAALRAPGVVYDPALVAPESIAAEDRPLPEGMPAELAAFVRRVNEVTNTPELPPATYRALFEALAEDLAASDYALWSTAKGVGDRLGQRAIDVPQRLIFFILRGLEYARHRFSPADTAELLALKFRDQVLYLCRAAGLTLEAAEVALIDRWITGAETAAEPASVEETAG